MNILILGASGFIGTALTYKLEKNHNLILVTRSAKNITTKNHPIITWSHLEQNPNVLSGVDCIVNLCGQSVLGIWSKRYRKKLLESRVKPLQTIARIMSNQDLNIPIISASGIGVSGYQDPVSLNELPPALDEEENHANPYYLQEIGNALENALPEAYQNNVCYLRFGVVLDPLGGNFPLMMLPHRFFLGAVPGSGAQPISWVSLIDAISAIEFAIDHQLKGPYNVVAQSLTAYHFHHNLAHAMKRRCFLRIPDSIFKHAGQCFSELLLKGQNISSQKIEKEGFKFKIKHLNSLLAGE